MSSPRLPLLSRTASSWPMLLVGALAFGLWFGVSSVRAMADPPDNAEAAEPDTNPGRFFTIQEPIDHDQIVELRASTKAFVARVAQEGKRPVLVFEFRSGSAQPGGSSYGAAYDLAKLLSVELQSVPNKVAYVPDPLSGYAVLATLGCNDIIMGPNATLGPIAPEGETPDDEQELSVRTITQRVGRDPGLFIGMLRPDDDLRKVRTLDGRVHFVPASRLADFRKENATEPGDEPAWSGGRRGVLSAQEARERGVCKMIAESRQDIARAYRMRGQSVADDPTLGQAVKPVWIRLQGPLDATKTSYVKRRIQQAQAEKANLLVLEMDTPGGPDNAADSLADAVADVKDMKTVAFLNDRCVGTPTLVALACDEIVFLQGARMGDVRRSVAGRRGQAQEFTPEQIQGLANKAEALAKAKNHPAALARALVDPSVVLVLAKDNRNADVRILNETEVKSDPERFSILERKKEAGTVLALDSERAQETEMAAHVVANAEEFQAIYGLKGRQFRIDTPTWVDGLVAFLNNPWMSWLLLFTGFFMMILELKLPGIGLPAILSALAFLLFFWSRYLSGTADQLEIMLFLVGLICLALEIFVFTGMGVFGMCGALLILISVVMASHTFIWPTQDYEFRQLGHTLIQILVTMIGVGAAAAIIGSRMNNLPLLKRLVLIPESAEIVPDGEGLDPDARPKPIYEEGLASLTFLVGETGRSTTVLRPSGKARFGDLLLDVIADGGYIEQDRLIEVIEVQGRRVLVKRV